MFVIVVIHSVTCYRIQTWFPWGLRSVLFSLLGCHLPGDVWFSSMCAKASHVSHSLLVQGSASFLLPTPTVHQSWRNKVWVVLCPLVSGSSFTTLPGWHAMTFSLWLSRMISPCSFVMGGKREWQEEGKERGKMEEGIQSKYVVYLQENVFVKPVSMCSEYTAIKLPWSQFWFSFVLW